MATLRRYFSKKLPKDIDKNLEGKFLATDEFSRQGSTSAGCSDEPGERRRIRSLSISRSGRFKQKKRDRSALQDRPDLYHSPTKPGDNGDDSGAIDGKQENMPSVHRQTTTSSNNNFASRVNLYPNQPRHDLGNESSTDSGLRESSSTTPKQTTATATAVATSINKHSINKILRPGCKGSETSGRLTTTMV